ncbi:DEAD/DEAH box helicase [Limnochorda pilosa]|uniref:ATP-dependent helicase n=1 Tax=Limnochorda pilosa TaxID=1555112 RepID=A0A0K2SL15_LIMPI|nr:SNF2-related protein [Limnochorda pilosa]BAS27687.1 ATP-dependent helicase [Limnochorda pilosa]
MPLELKVTVPILHGSWVWAPPRARAERWSEPIRGGELDLQASLTGAARILRALGRARRQGPDPERLAWFGLAWRLHVLEPVDRGDLLAPRLLAQRWREVGVIPYPHQLETARRVVEDLDGRAILADEVGLGKTLEAGLVLKEYLLRGQVERALVLCPAALVYQWYQELREKLDVQAIMQRDPSDWERPGVIIGSLDLAKRSPHREILAGQRFDLLIVDEAHKLKNPRTQNHKLVQAIPRTYTLLVTATPVQNGLEELYHLTSLLRPGQLGTYRTFQAAFMIDRHTPRAPEELRRLLGRVLIRHRHREVAKDLPERRVETLLVDPTREERAFYDAVTDLVRREYRRLGTLAGMLPLITLQRELASSVEAACATLEHLLDQGDLEPELAGRLLEQARSVSRQAKLERCLELVRATEGQVLLFTEYRATQGVLLGRLQAEGIVALAFDGSLSASRKAFVRELFRRRGQVLVSTDSGAEGLNFQFCHHLIHYDLPWNPMRLEQRIGRVHRLGQTQPVLVRTLAVRGSVESYMLYLLQQKIRLFESVIGELDAILSGAALQTTVEAAFTRALLESRDEADLLTRLDELAGRILQERRRLDESRERVPWL